MENNNNKGLLKFIKCYWQILIFITGMIVAWTVVQTTTANNSERIEKLEVAKDEITKDISDIKTSIKGIETSIGFLVRAAKD